MKKNHKKWLVNGSFLTSILLLIQLSSFSQSLLTDAFVSMRPAGTPGIVIGNYYVEVADTNNVSQIEIKLGTSWGGTEYVNEVLDYDVTTGLPAGFSYSRTGIIITIGIGQYAENAAYYGEVRVKDNNGAWSSIYPFVSN